MMRAGRRGQAVVALAALVASAASCLVLARAPAPEQELAELLQWLPGHYDNSAQEQADVREGVRPPHDALALDLVAVDAPMIGEHVFYLRETAADDPRRVTSQRILVFAVVKKEIVQSAWMLTDPHRWRNARRDPEMFKSMMVDDVRALKGCSLKWKREGSRFVASDDPKSCHELPGVSTAQSEVQLRAELGPEEFAYAELAFDQDGKLVRGRSDSPFYRFHKQSAGADD